jgi:glycosyltransferase involved in cell wall biosynthesis
MNAMSSSVRPSLLFLCQTLPFPPDGGVSVRTYNVLRLLAREFTITALCFYRRAERSSPEAVSQSVRGLSRFAHVEAFPIPQEHSRVRLLADHSQSLVRLEAYTRWTYESREYRARIASHLAAGQVNLVHMDSLDLAGYLPLLAGVPVVCTHHNVESLLLRRRALAERTPWRRAYLRLQSAWVEKLERYWCGRVALNIAVSEPDRQKFVRIAPRARFSIIPNGVDVDAIRPMPGPQEGVVFVGGSGWFPNRDALEYFSKEILPLVRAGGTNPVVRWVGRSSESDRQYYARHDRIDLTGYVEDVRPIIAGAACYVVPLRVGGGTRLKILEAWAMGKAVVSTSIGCEGLEATDGENILVRDTPVEFAKAVRDVMLDSALRERLGQAARTTAERRYGWSAIGAELNRLYLPLVESRREP